MKFNLIKFWKIIENNLFIEGLYFIFKNIFLN